MDKGGLAFLAKLVSKNSLTDTALAIALQPAYACDSKHICGEKMGVLRLTVWSMQAGLFS